MIRSFLAFVALLLVGLAPGNAAAQSQRIEEAVFAGGCFWCMEHDFRAVPGVISVESGFTGGALPNPTYDDVLTQRTGHYEAVRVRFDANRITYRQVLDRYWRLIDPTDDAGQFCDRGPSYRSAIFVTPEQSQTARASKAALVASRQIRGQIITPILPLGTFYMAEEYHRDYARRNPERYAQYRQGCGRDIILRRLWGRA